MHQRDEERFRWLDEICRKGRDPIVKRLWFGDSDVEAVRFSASLQAGYLEAGHGVD